MTTNTMKDLNGCKPEQFDTICFKSLDTSIRSSTEALVSQQREDGHWRYALESHAGLSAEYLLCLSFIGEEVNTFICQSLGRYIRRTQGASGAWGLTFSGEPDVSVSVVAYLALRILGDTPSDPHMRRARDAILKLGGAEKCNSISRVVLILQGILPWGTFPAIPVEAMFLPPWFPITIFKFACWARTTTVPLLVLRYLKARPRKALPFNINELFLGTPAAIKNIPPGPHNSPRWHGLFRRGEKVVRVLEPLVPRWVTRRAVEKALAFIQHRQNGTNGYASLAPPMTMLVMLYESLGHPDRALARQALDTLLHVQGDEAFVQPALSPMWDTALAVHALLETGSSPARAAAQRAMGWVRPRQNLTLKGDWASARPNLRPGGWALYPGDPHYPDTDDTSVVLLAMDRLKEDEDREAMERGLEWIQGMQCRNGGWGAFDADNTCTYLNNVPWADYSSFLDPPTVDVTSRCLLMLETLGHGPSRDPSAQRALSYVLGNQEPDGSWYGRWGVNYIYGTWSALEALIPAGISVDDSRIVRAVGWLLSIQNGDGGWGEGCESYRHEHGRYMPAESTASQTSWALLALMSTGQVREAGVARGISYLMRSQNGEGQWTELQHTGNGHPNLMYLRYHGYSKYFPLLTLARYRRLMASQS